MKILLVDDDAGLLEQLRRELATQKYLIDTAADGQVALDKLFDNVYDLVVLDIMLPEVDGLSVLRDIRNAGIKTPVLLLTARSSIEDRVEGLDDGADDYLAKPFAMAELLARMRSLFRRAGGQADAVLSAGNIILNTMTREVLKAGDPVQLTPKEFSILEFLFYNQNRVVSRFTLAEHVWGDEFDPFTMSNFIDVHIKNLRCKIGDAGSRSLIRTIRGIGFMVGDE